jgi:DNA polymerase III delta prime subunit
MSLGQNLWTLPVARRQISRGNPHLSAVAIEDIMKSMQSGHAYIAAGRSEDLPAARGLLEGWGVETHRNPDLYERSFGAFGIDDARALSERASLRALGKRRVFLIAVDSISPEAQNALLKTLEEPPAGALFFFLHPAPQTLLPTVRSRVQIIDLPHRIKTSGAIDIDAFLKATPAKRLDIVKPLLEKSEDDKRDLGEILAFLSALEETLYANKASAEALHALYRARKYIGDRGALVKPLLEKVALMV